MQIVLYILLCSLCPQKGGHIFEFLYVCLYVCLSFILYFTKIIISAASPTAFLMRFMHLFHVKQTDFVGVLQLNSFMSMHINDKTINKIRTQINKCLWPNILFSTISDPVLKEKYTRLFVLLEFTSALI